MLATTRLRSLLIILGVFLLGLPSLAQFQGVPPGQFQGVPATPFQGVPTIPFQGVPSGSFGAHAYGGSFGPAGGCCANFFLPSGFSPLVPVPALAEEHHRHRRHKQGDEAFGTVAVPVYVPYAVPYGAEPDEDAAGSQDSADPASEGYGAENQEAVVRRHSNRFAGQETGQYSDRNSATDPGSDGESESGYGPDSAPADAAPEKPEEPVVAQPTTVLVFKDGRRFEVVNYAIVGDTLFDFAQDRTHKILLADLDLPATRRTNDDRGVEFKLPAGSK
ncbi:MAG: hypothetical protein WA172_12345 [Terriglobales bacterium]